MSPAEFIDQSVIPVTQNLIASLICVMIGMAIQSKKAKIASLRIVATRTTQTIWMRNWRNLARLFGLWFMFSELRSLLLLPGPPSRGEVALIAFWVACICLLWAAMLFVKDPDD